MTSEPLASAIVGHFLGDFLCQTDWMAKNKKLNSWICALHVTIYTFCVMLYAGWFRIGLEDALPAFVGIWLPHFFIYRTKFVTKFMTCVGQEDFMKNLAPWSVIAVDQAMHFVCLYWIVQSVQQHS